MFSLYFKNPSVDAEPTLNKNLQAFCSVIYPNYCLFLTGLIFSESHESMKKGVSYSFKARACFFRLLHL